LDTSPFLKSMMNEQSNTTHLPEGQLWFGILCPPIVWAIQMQTNYSLVPFECFGGSRLPMLTTSFVAFVISALAGVIAFKNWRRFGSDWPDDASGSRRPLFMSALGLLVSGMFSLGIRIGSLLCDQHVCSWWQTSQLARPLENVDIRTSCNDLACPDSFPFHHRLAAPLA
jgi:hypothetical protein